MKVCGRKSGLPGHSVYEEYRDYGSEWMPTSPATWKPTRLRFLSRMNPGKSEVNSVSDTTEVSFLPMELVTEEGNVLLESVRPLGEVRGGYTYFRDGDVLVAKITPCFENGKGAVCRGLTNGLGFGTTEFHVLRAGREVSPEFIFYVTRTHPFRIIGEAFMTGAAGQKRVPEDFIRNFRIGLPPLAEQRGIVAFLDRETARIDAMIAKKERLIALLEEKRTALISALVTGKLSIIEDPGTGLPRAMDDAELARLNQHTPAPRILLDASRRKPSAIPWLGDIPEHWETMRLKFGLRTIEQGWSPQCEHRLADGDEWGVLKVGCVNDVTFNPNEHKALPSNLEPIPEYEIATGDVLVSRANTRDLLGSASCVGVVRHRLLLCDKLYRLRPRQEMFEPEYLALLLRTKSARHQMEVEATGASASMQNIGQDTVRNLLVAVPPLEDQAQIVSEFRTLSNRIAEAMSKNSEVIKKLGEHRAALITAAVTGQIDVRGREAIQDSAEVKKVNKTRSIPTISTEMQTHFARRLVELSGIGVDLPGRMAELSRTATQPSKQFEEATRNMVQPLEQIRLQISPNVAQQLESAARAVEHWHRSLLAPWAETLQAAHQSWVSALNPLVGNIARFQAEIEKHLVEIARALDFSSTLLGRVDFERIQKALAVPPPTTRNLRRTVVESVSSYDNFVESIHFPSELLQLPEFILPGATQEIMTTGYVLTSLDLGLQDQEPYFELIEAECCRIEEIRCEELLARVHPDLVVPYRGARDALASDSVDRARHVLTSLRELWSHVLRRLAPDALISKWTTDSKHYHEGKPTRKARISYICRDLCHDAFANFMDADTGSLIALIEFLNHVHDIKPRLTSIQLKALVLRTETWLMYLLQIDGETRR